MKIWRRKVCWVWWMETLKTEVTDVCNRRMGWMWPSNVMKQQNTSSELPTTLRSDCWIQMVHYQVTTWWIGDRGPVTHVMLQNRPPLTLLEQRQHHFTGRRLCTKFLRVSVNSDGASLLLALCDWKQLPQLPSSVTMCRRRASHSFW